MKRSQIWILIAIGFFIVISAIGYHHATRNKRRHQAGASPVEIYQLYCARCHGQNGEGRDDYPKLSSMSLGLDDFAHKMKTGANLMPSFADTLEDRELEPLYQYIRREF